MSMQFLIHAKKQKKKKIHQSILSCLKIKFSFKLNVLLKLSSVLRACLCNIWVLHLWQKPVIIMDFILVSFVKVDHCSNCNWETCRRIFCFLWSFMQHYKTVNSSARSACLKNILIKLGVDTNTFKQISNRSASSSKAGLRGASMLQ